MLSPHLNTSLVPYRFSFPQNVTNLDGEGGDGLGEDQRSCWRPRGLVSERQCCPERRVSALQDHFEKQSNIF